jgi:superfamily II DNA or RNA helicase
VETKVKLRDFQQDTADKIRAKLQCGVNRQLIKYATGLGKTPLFSALPDHLGLKGRMLVVDHREELTNQALDKLKKWNPGRTVGVEMGDRRSNWEQIVVAGVATIGRKGSPRLTQFNPADFDIIVVDEAHHATAQSYRTIFDHFMIMTDTHRLLLGVTATPNRADGTGLGEIFQEIVDDKDILFGILHGWLADIRGIRIKTGVTLDGVHNRVGDFDQAELGSTVNTPARNDLIARSWLEHANDRQTVMFTVDVAHAKNLAEAFTRRGVASEAIWGGDPDRAAKLARHQRGEIKVLTNCQLLTEGYDDWRVACIGVTRPTQSEGLYTQIIGRGTRIPGDIENLLTARRAEQHIAKADCIVMDFVDATSKHSLVTLPTLFGMGATADLRGKAISKVVAEINQVKLRNPLLDLTKVDDVYQLQAYAEQVDLFKVSFPPEIIQLSDYQWHKSRENAYVLCLLNRESVCVMSDLLGVWHILGDCNGNHIRDTRPSFAEAIKEADWKVGMLGGRGLLSVIKREAKWHKLPPTPAQLALCRRCQIVVPPGATSGEVAMKVTAELRERAQRRADTRAARRAEEMKIA